MKEYLITTTEQYRVDSEQTAANLINEAKSNKNFALIKQHCEHKERKAKGEVIDSYYRVTLTKQFNEEKEPVVNYKISQEVDL